MKDISLNFPPCKTCHIFNKLKEKSCLNLYRYFRASSIHTNLQGFKCTYACLLRPSNNPYNVKCKKVYELNIFLISYLFNKNKRAESYPEMIILLNKMLYNRGVYDVAVLYPKQISKELKEGKSTTELSLYYLKIVKNYTMLMG